MYVPRRAELPVVLALVLAFTLACADSDGGVELPNQMSANDRAHAEKVLRPGEQVRAYYDATISLDGTELAVVTDQRVVYLNGGVTTEMALADVTAVDHTTDGISGDVIDVRGTDGQRMRVEIAAMNNGDVFAQVLKEATGK